MSFGVTEILIVAAIVVLLFGSSMIPRFVRSLTSARDEFEAGRHHDTVA
jgi:TatA/E family protein of Tat protein translocase